VGNSVVLTGQGAGTEVWTLNLTWISETAFQGTGRLDDAPDYVNFEGAGFLSAHLPLP
jgi:hypothetical protein